MNPQTTTEPQQISTCTTAHDGQYLAAHHRDALHKSGLDDDTIAARGYKTAQFKTDLTSVGFSPWQARHAPALLIPIHDVRGNLSLHQMRPDTPPIIEGKSTKYMTPRGANLCLDVPLSVRPMLPDVTIPLIPTEGSKKVDAGVQRGLCMIGLLGVTAGMRDGELHPDWKDIALDGRPVYIGFDADFQKKKEVWQATRTLKAALEGEGARVYILYLPDDPNDPGKKIGIDDFFAAGHTVEDLFALASETLCPCPSAANTLPRNELEKLRLSALTEKLRGIADVNPQGGLLISKEATLDELTNATHAVCYFYGRIGDLQKWDMVDLWQALKPHVPYRDNGAWKVKLFGRFAAQLSNWISKVGAFAADPALRRPHLPFWLHEYVRDLTHDQQQTVFDTFEAAGRLSQSDVQRMIEKMVGVKEAARREPPPGSPGADSSLVSGYWQRLAQIFPESAAEELIRLVHERGAARSEQVLRSAIETELSRVDEPDIWDGYDVVGIPPDFTGSEDSDYNFILPPVTDTSEIKNSRQTSRRVFTAVKSKTTKRLDLESTERTDESFSPASFHSVLDMEVNNSYSIKEEESDDRAAGSDGDPPALLSRPAAPGEHSGRHLTSVGEVMQGDDLKWIAKGVEQYAASDKINVEENTPYAFADLLAAAYDDSLPKGHVTLDAVTAEGVHNMKNFVITTHNRFTKANQSGDFAGAALCVANLHLCRTAWKNQMNAPPSSSSGGDWTAPN